MSPKRLRSSDKEEEEEEPKHYSDPLHTLLPDELLRLILSKITDPKTLLRSSLISKRIASIISLSQSLSLQYPTDLPLTKLLGRFNGVRSLRVVFPFSFRSPEDIVFKWKAKTDIQCRILAVLSAKSVSKIDDKKAKVEAEEEEEGVEDFRPWADKAAEPFYHLSDAHRMIGLLISHHPNLVNLEVVDPKKYGKLSLGRENLIKLRTNTILDSPVETTAYFGGRWIWSYKVWYASKLRLTLSGYEMKQVSLVVFRGDEVADGNGGWGDGNGDGGDGNGGGGAVDDNGDQALDGGFEDDEHGIFGEAMTQMLTKRPVESYISRASSGKCLVIS